jgi:hypothetical protein
MLKRTLFTNFKSPPLYIEKSIRTKKMSVDPKQQPPQPPPIDKTKVIGFRVTEEELHNTIYTL